jgi:hypothetical protein
MATRAYGTTVSQSDSERPLDEARSERTESPGESEHDHGADTVGARIDDTTESTVINPAKLTEPRKPKPKQKGGAEKRRDAAKRAAAKRASNRDASTASSKARGTQTTTDLKVLLYSTFSVLATLAQEPIIEITEDEAEKLASSINRVTALYDVPIFDEKTWAWIHLGRTGLEVFGTRAMAIVIDKKRRQGGPQVVTPMKSAHPNPPPQPVTVGDAYRESQVIDAQA